jgi:hypothetical protein
VAETQTQEQQQEHLEGKQELAKAAAKPLMVRGERGVELKSFTDLASYAQCIVHSGLAPKGFETWQAILVAIESGASVGLPPMASVQNIAVINGRPQFYGDIPLAIVSASGLLEDFREYTEGTGETMTAVCVSKRRGWSEPLVTKFGVQDAKRAGLWGKSGPWTQYPGRMLKWRARGFNLRDQFADVLKGMASEFDPHEVIDVVPVPGTDGAMTYTSRSDALAAKMRAAAQSAGDPRPPAAEAAPGPDEVPPTAPADEAPASDPDNGMPWDEALCISIGEAKGMEPSAVRAILDAKCAALYQRKLVKLTSKQQQEIEDHLMRGSIKIG